MDCRSGVSLVRERPTRGRRSQVCLPRARPDSCRGVGRVRAERAHDPRPPGRAGPSGLGCCDGKADPSIELAVARTVHEGHQFLGCTLTDQDGDVVKGYPSCHLRLQRRGHQAQQPSGNDTDGSGSRTSRRVVSVSTGMCSLAVSGAPFRMGETCHMWRRTPTLLSPSCAPVSDG